MEDNPAIDPSLDFTSDQFDALKALHTRTLQPPCQDARPFDNLALYWAAVQRQNKQAQDKDLVKEDYSVSATPNVKKIWKGKKIKDLATSSARIANEQKKARKSNTKVDVLQKMKDLSGGPFCILHQAVEEKRPVNIWTRSYKSSRGICHGYVAAFDKHMNVALVDVDEVYTLPDYFLRSAGGKNSGQSLAKNVSNQSIAEAVLQLQKMHVRDGNCRGPNSKAACWFKAALHYQATSQDRIKRVINFGFREDVIMTDENVIIIKRHLQQVYLRGENIVLISLAKLI